MILPRRHDAPGHLDPEAVLRGAHGHGYLLVDRGHHHDHDRTRQAPTSAAHPGTSGAASPDGSTETPDGSAGPAGEPPCPDVQGWRHLTDVVPGADLYLQPRTVLGHHRGTSVSVALLGHPVDVDHGIVDSTRLARRLTMTWELSGEDALVREAATLGGRWTLLVATAEQLLVVPDTHATQPVLYAEGDGRLALASAPGLVARTLGLDVDKESLALLAELDRRREHAVTYLPGLRTPYLGVRPVVPNCLLRVRRDPLRTSHERFWPWQERVESHDLRGRWELFRDRLTEHTRLLTGLGRPAVSLTAGGDSRVTAALARPWLAEREGFAFTFVNPRDARRSPAAFADVTGASAVADRLGLPHRLLHWRQPPRSGTFETLHRRTYAPLTPSAGAAYSMWIDLPEDIVQLQSNCAETGTCFIRERTPAPLTPRRLAQLMMSTSDDSMDDLAGPLFEGYLEHAQLSPERLLGHDHHDLFYWEQRMGRWGHQKFQDGDLGHRVLLPFNDRVLLEVMLSLPEEQRASRALFDRVWAMEPRAKVPHRGTTVGSVAASVATTVSRGVPGPAGRTLTRAVSGVRRRRSVPRLTFPLGYAVLPAGAGRRTRVPAGWARTALPAPDGTIVLRRHPGLPSALAEDGDRWVLVLGRPADLERGRVGAHALAEDLLLALQAAGAAGPELAVRQVAALVGRYVVVLGGRERWVVVPDPLGSIAVHATPAGGLVSHPRLVEGATAPSLHPDHVLEGRAGGPWTPAALDLSAVPTVEEGGRQERLRRHLTLVGGLGAHWLGLSGDAASAALLPAVAALGGRAVTWWDRTAEDRIGAAVVRASQQAWEADVQHRVVGVHEDVDGSRDDPGRTQRALARSALVTTWGEEGEQALPVSPALDEVLPAAAHLVLGGPCRSSDVDRDRLAARPWELVQNVRRVILPLSDRAL